VTARARALTALCSLGALALTASGCGSSGPAIETIPSHGQLKRPSALAFRPGEDAELWITNHGDDSISIVTGAGGDEATIVNRRDAYAEHFVARPAGIAFDEAGDEFAIANDSNNEVRHMHFELNPERNRYFKNSNFMGPTLFETATYARAGQNKRYLQDWPQPGYGHDPPDDSVSRSDCPDAYWQQEASACVFPREGSHVDMLHETPLSMGILHWTKNVYFVLDGCGTRTADNSCRGDGGVVMADFNRDHGEGNGFHGDGVIERYLDAPFDRVAGVPAGILEHDGLIYYADTGAGVVRRLRPDAGEREVLVCSWHPGGASHHRQGTGISDWADATDGPADGDKPDAIDHWIATKGRQARIEAAGTTWIKPQETLGQYSYRRGATGEPVVPRGQIKHPSGMAADDQHLYVADHATGEIHTFDWDGMRAGPVLDSGAAVLGGIAIDPAQPDWIYFSDMDANSVGRISLD